MTTPTLSPDEALIDWLDNFARADLDDVVADGGITAGMVFQQEARTVFGPKLRNRLAALTAGGAGRVTVPESLLTFQQPLAELLAGGGPHEWGYRDPTDGTFIADNAPFELANRLEEIRQSALTPQPAWQPTREAVAALFPRVWPGGFEDQSRRPDGGGWVHPPWTPNKRALDLADAILALFADRPKEAAAPQSPTGGR